MNKTKALTTVDRAKRDLYELVFLVSMSPETSSVKITAPEDREALIVVTLYRLLPGPVGSDRGESAIGTFSLLEALEYMRGLSKDGV